VATEETMGVAEVEASGVSTGVAELTIGTAELTTGTAELDPAGGWAPYPPLLGEP
jgi:X-X-X-Leu-X-X-Gly heptad repeat protein